MVTGETVTPFGRGMDVSGRKLVVFDFDGTLSNTIEGITSTARTVLRAHGLSGADMGDLRRIVGPPFPEAFSLVYGFSTEEAEQITDEYRAIYNTLGAEAFPAIPGMADLADSLREVGKVLGVASSKRAALLERGMRESGLAPHFDVYLGKLKDGDDTKAKTIVRVMDQTGLGAADAVMVGDRFYDVAAATEVGIPCVGVHYAHTCEVEELWDAGAVAVAETVEELRGILLG